MQSKKGAIAARISTDKQDEASIEVQVAACRRLAARDGLTIDDDRVYADIGVSGQAKGMAKREQWHRLEDLWEAGEVDIIYANELSRLTRDELHAAQLKRRVERTGVAIVTADGIDTRTQGWQINWALRAMMSSEEVRRVAKRVSDSMLGVVRRGGMLSAPAFGYMLDPLRRPAEEKSVGARWVVHEGNAMLVREMYRMRRAGLAHFRIARWLNEEGVPSPRCARDGGPSSWRQASVQRVLANPIYRGVLLYNGSAYTRARLRREFNRAPEVSEHDREHLRLVDDETWFACNPPPRQRLRSGVKHPLVGLLRCGDCGCKLSLKFRKDGGGGASCPTCDHAFRAGASQGWMGYTSVGAATAAMRAALQELFTPAVMETFKARLRARLEAPAGTDEVEAEERVRLLKSKQQKLLQLAANPSIGVEVIEASLAEVTTEVKQAEGRLGAIRRERKAFSAAEVRRHLQVDVSPLLRRLLEGEPEVHEARAVLSRLLRHFRFVSRPQRHVSVFQVEFALGAVTAEATGGQTIDDSTVGFRVTVRYTQRGPEHWKVSVLTL